MNEHRDAVRESSNQAMKSILDDWKSRISSHKAKTYARAYPDYPTRARDRHKDTLLPRVLYLRGILEKIKPLIYDLKKHISEITEETRICAIYLLFGSIISRWEAVFYLLEQGKSYESMELVRSIQEALDLIELFISDSDDENLKKWFSGQIVENSKSRNIFDKLLEHLPLVRHFSAYKIKTYIYKVLSGYTHSAYPAIATEMVDVFTEDLDKKSIAGYYRAFQDSQHLKTTMETTLIQMKSLFLYLEDPVKYAAVNRILISVADKLTVDEEDIENLKKFKK